MTIDERRKEASRHLAKMTTIYDFRRSLDGAKSGDEIRVIVALPDDSVEYVTGCLRDAGGLAAVVCVDLPSKRIALATVQQSVRPREATDGPVHVASEIGLLFEYMRTADLKSMNFHLTSGDARVDLIDSGDEITLPT